MLYIAKFYNNFKLFPPAHWEDKALFNVQVINQKKRLSLEKNIYKAPISTYELLTGLN